MSSRRWVVGVVALAAILLLFGGGALALRRLGPTEAEAPAATDPAHELPPLNAGRKRPRDFSLPEAPLAYGFHSQDTNERDADEPVKGTDQGSASYRVRSGAAEKILGHYRAELPKLGWEFVRESRSRLSPPEGGPSQVVGELTGSRLFWRRKDRPRGLTVLVVDFQQRDSTAQVSLELVYSD